MWIDTNHSGAYEAGIIATTDIGENQGNDFFLVVQPTKYMDPGDDFTLQIYNVWYAVDPTQPLGQYGDTLRITKGGTHITTRFTTHRMRNQVVTNDVLTDETTPGLLAQPGSVPHPAIGINVFDPSGAGELHALRVYFNPQGNYDPNHLFATLSGNAAGGLSLWNVVGDTNIPLQATTWHNDVTDSLVYHKVTVPPTPPAALLPGTVLKWFQGTENICWADNDKDAKWSEGDALWIDTNTGIVPESAIRYNHGADTPLVATAANDGDYGVVVHHATYGFAYHDENKDDLFDPTSEKEDVFFLGPGRSTLGWYADLVLATPRDVPTTDAAPNAGKDFEIRFRTNDNPPIFGTLGWTFSIPHQSILYNTGPSSANRDLTTTTTRLEVVPSTIADFTAARGAGRVTLAWTLPVATFQSVIIVRTPDQAPGTEEVPKLGVPYAVGQPLGRGTVVYMGDGIGFVDNGVANGTPYYYWAFAGDRTPTGRGTEDMVQATPWPVTPTEDSTPPGIVTNLVATPGDNLVDFAWNDPLDLDLANVIVVRSSTDYPVLRPANETDYQVGDDLGDGVVVAIVAPGAQSCRDDGDAGAGVDAPANGTTYYYAFYTRDSFLNYSAPVHINCMPSDGTAQAPRSVTSFGLSVVVDPFGNHDVNLAWNWPAPVGTPETGLIIVRHFGSPITGAPGNGRLYRVGDLLGTGETGTVVAIVNGTDTLTHTDQDVLGGGMYYYAAFTFNGTLAYSAGAYASQVVSSAVVTYQDLTAAGQTIEFNSDPTPVIGINMYDNDEGVVLSAVTVQFNRLGNNSIYDLTDLAGASTASGVALYRDSNGNGVFDLGVDQLVPFTVGGGWSRGRPAFYDAKMDTRILGTTNWQAVDGVPGIQTGVFYADTNNNGRWDPAEGVWRGSQTYTAATAVLLGGTTPADPTDGIQTGLFYHDADDSSNYTDGESLWRDESWPRMLTMNLTSGLDVPNTDPGARPDLFVVVRTSATIRYGTQIQFAIPGTFGLTFFGEEAGVAGMTTNAISCRIPATLANLVAGGQTIPVSSPSTPVIAMDLADPAQTVDSLLLDVLNVGGDFAVTPSDFINYQNIAEAGPISMWRDVRPIAPSSLGGIITADATEGGRTFVRVRGTDFAMLGVRVGDTIRRVQGAVTTTAAVTALQSSASANDTLVFMGGLTGANGDHSLDPGDTFTVEARFLVASSPVIHVADATHYPDAGILLLGRELVAYDGKDANNNLLGIVRGVQGTQAAIASHPVGEALRFVGMAAELDADLTAAATTLHLAANQGARFPDPDNGYTAYVRIASEIVGYRKRDGDQLQQCIRGTRGSDPIPHIAGMQVVDATVLTLATDIGTDDTEIDLLQRPFAPAAETGVGHLTLGLEVVSYGAVVRLADGWRLIDCVRGTSGTTAATHAAGDAAVQGRPGTFDLATDSLVSLASLPASGMSIPLNIRNQRLSPMVDGIMDFFVTVNTSDSATHNDDFQIRLASGALDFSVPAASDTWRGVTSAALRVNAIDNTDPVITQVRTLDVDGNGRLDHARVTFSEPILDESLSGYVSEAVAFLTDRWTVQGYEGVGIDSSIATGMVDGVNDKILLLYFDEAAIDIPAGSLGDTGDLLSLGTAGSTLTDLSHNPLRGGLDYAPDELLPLTIDGAAPVLVDAASDRPLSAAGEIAAGTILTLRFSEPIASLDDTRILPTDFRTSSDGLAALANGFAGVTPADVTAAIDPNGCVALTFLQESNSAGAWAEEATLNLDPDTISEGDIVDLVGFNAKPAPAAVPIRGLGSVILLSAQTGDANSNGRIDYIRLAFDRPVDDSTLAGYSSPAATIDVAKNGDHFQVLGRGQVMIDLDGPFDDDLPNNEVLYLTFGEGGVPDTDEKPDVVAVGTTLRSLDGERTRDFTEHTTDGAPPVIINVVTYDRNDNGAVDTAVLVFSEPVDDTTVDPADFTVGGMATSKFLDDLATLLPAYPDVANDEIIGLQITDPANEVPGTEFKTVAYTNNDDGTDLADLVVGNKTLSDANGGRWGNQEDAAKPTIQSARTLTDASIEVVFTEEVLGVTAAMLLVHGGAVPFETLAKTGDRTYVWSDPAGDLRWNTDATGAGPGDIDDIDGYRSTDSQGVPRDVVPNLTVAAGAFSDEWGNTNLDITDDAMATDGVAPVVLAVSTFDANADGRVESALLVLSEPMEDTTLLPAQFRIGGVVGTGLNSGDHADDQAFTVQHGGVPGTSLKAVAYAPGIAADRNGNPLAGGNDLGLLKTDAAKPVVLTATTRSDSSIELRFSEPIAQPDSADLTAADGAITFATVDASANPVILWSEANATWNTDATGTSPGLGADADGVVRAAIPNVAVAAGDIQDLNGNGSADFDSDATLDGAPPVVTKLYSDVPFASTHTLGKLVPVFVMFSERVTVAGGTPTLDIQVSQTAQRTLAYQSGSGNRTIRFNYVVQADDNRRDPDFLDATGTDALALAGSTITDSAPIPNQAILTLPAPRKEYVGEYGPLYGHHIQIDTVPPEILAARTVDHDTVELSFTEPVTDASIAAALLAQQIRLGGGLPYDTVSANAEGDDPLGAGSHARVYLHVGPDKRWNTDATGTDAGVGTDGTGLSRTTVPLVLVLADALFDEVGNKLALVAFDGTTDGAPPVPIAAAYRNSAAVASARVSSLRIRFSEPVQLDSLAGWTLDPKSLPLDATLGDTSRPDDQTVAIAVTATGNQTGVNAGTEPTLDYDGTGTVRDRSPAANALADFAAPFVLADEAGPVLLSAELATPSIARLTFSEQVANVEANGTDFAHSTSTITAATALNAWANARVTLDAPLPLDAETSIRFAAAFQRVTDAGGNPRVHVADAQLAAYGTYVHIAGPDTDVMHRGSDPIPVPGLVNVRNADPEDDLDQWNLYLVQGHGDARKDIGDETTKHLLLEPQGEPLAPDEGVLGTFTPDTHAVDGVYEYTLVLEIRYNGGETLHVYREIFVATQVPEVGSVHDGDVAGQDIAFQKDGATLQATWNGIGVEGVVTKGYRVAYTDAQDVYPGEAGWTDVGDVTAATIDGLALANGTTYFFKVAAYDEHGNIVAWQTSDGVTIDQDGPVGETDAVRDGIQVGQDLFWQIQADRFAANWDDFADPLFEGNAGTSSGVASYQMAVYRQDGDTPDHDNDTRLLDYTDVGNVPAAELAVALEHATTYYVAVRAVDAVGNVGEPVYSDGATVDIHAPEPMMLDDGQGGTKPAVYIETVSPASLRAYWAPFTDDVSGPTDYALTYQYRIVSGDDPTPWTASGLMDARREKFTSVPLADRRLLVAGGWDGTRTLATVEVFDPATEAWTTLAPMSTPRMNASGILLPDGRVLVAGGEDATACLRTIEVYDPQHDAWTIVGQFEEPRTQATVALIGDENDFAAWFMGGRAASESQSDKFLNSIEQVQAPAVQGGEWSVSRLASTLTQARFGAKAVTLDDGRILVIGGQTGTEAVSGTVNIYNPATDAWTSDSLHTPRKQFAACHIPGTDQVLVMGGRDASGALRSVELFDGTDWQEIASMASARYAFGAAWVDGAGQVLVAGGFGPVSNTNACETYDPAARVWSPAPVLVGARCYHSLAVFDSGLCLVYGGRRGSLFTRACETSRYPEALSGWAQLASAATEGYLEHVFDPETEVQPLDGHRYIAQVRATDDAGNTSAIFASDGMVADLSVPDVVITAPAGPTNDNPLVFHVEFTKRIFGFDSDDLTIVNGAVDGFTGREGTAFDIEVEPDGDGEVTLSIAAGRVADSAENPNTASNAASVVYWGVAGPTCALAAVGDITSSRLPAIPFVATFSHEVDGFEGTFSIGVQNGRVTTSPASADRKVYTFTVTATTEGGVEVWVKAAAGMDAVGNFSQASPRVTVAYDLTPPVAELTNEPADPTSQTAIDVIVGGDGVATYTYSLDGKGGGNAADIATHIVADDLEDGEHTLLVWGIDAVGNKQLAPTEHTWTVDTVPPVATLTSLSGTTTFENPIRFRMEFDKDMDDVTADSLQVGNGTVVDFVGESAKVYTFGVQPTIARGYEMTVTVTLPNGAAQDKAGNPCPGAAQSVNFFTEPPAQVTLLASAAHVAVGESFEVRVYVKERSDAANGFRGGPLDLQFAPARAELADTAFDPDGAFVPANVLNAVFTQDYVSGTVDKASGLVDELGGGTTDDNYGEGELDGEPAEGVLYATLPFVATAPGAFTIQAMAAEAGLSLTPPRRRPARRAGGLRPGTHGHGHHRRHAHRRGREHLRRERRTGHRPDRAGPCPRRRRHHSSRPPRHRPPRHRLRGRAHSRGHPGRPQQRHRNLHRHRRRRLQGTALRRRRHRHHGPRRLRGRWHHRRTRHHRRRRTGRSLRGRRNRQHLRLHGLYRLLRSCRRPGGLRSGGRPERRWRHRLLRLRHLRGPLRNQLQRPAPGADRHPCRARWRQQCRGDAPRPVPGDPREALRGRCLREDQREHRPRERRSRCPLPVGSDRLLWRVRQPDHRPAPVQRDVHQWRAAGGTDRRAGWRHLAGRPGIRPARSLRQAPLRRPGRRHGHSRHRSRRRAALCQARPHRQAHWRDRGRHLRICPSGRGRQHAARRRRPDRRDHSRHRGALRADGQRRQRRRPRLRPARNRHRRLSRARHRRSGSRWHHRRLHAQCWLHRHRQLHLHRQRRHGRGHRHRHGLRRRLQERTGRPTQGWPALRHAVLRLRGRRQRCRRPRRGRGPAGAAGQ